jgi:septum formation protein
MSIIKHNTKIILASSSAIRKKIMEDVGLDFEAISPDFDEEQAKNENPNLKIEDLALFLARGKALSISKKFPNHLIIGCDQICEVEGQKFDKSKDENEAFTQLKAMSGKTHYQNNGLVIALNDKIIFEKLTKVELKLRKISDDEIRSYIAIDKPWGSAGSYKYESFGKHLFAKLNGDCYSVLGLNIQEILNFLHDKKYIQF